MPDNQNGTVTDTRRVFWVYVPSTGVRAAIRRRLYGITRVIERMADRIDPRKGFEP